MILSGAGLIDASESNPVYQHMAYTSDNTYNSAHKYGATPATPSELEGGKIIAVLEDDPSKIENLAIVTVDKNHEGAIYVMIKDGDEIVTEPYLTSQVGMIFSKVNGESMEFKCEPFAVSNNNPVPFTKTAVDALVATGGAYEGYNSLGIGVIVNTGDTVLHGLNTTKTQTMTFPTFDNNVTVLVDCYIVYTEGAKQIEITPDKFGGSFYLEASTLWRDTNGTDVPAEFVIPNCRVQSNFTFTMSGSGDPQSFTFTMDSFPDYTRWDKTQKVLANIQVIGADKMADTRRYMTKHDSSAHDEDIG